MLGFVITLVVAIIAGNAADSFWVGLVTFITLPFFLTLGLYMIGGAAVIALSPLGLILKVFGRKDQ